MLISDEHQLILMLPQKCGSKTLQSRLKSIHSCAEVGSSPYYDPVMKRYLSKHITFRVAQQLSAFKKRKNYQRACFVRNPYDRVYSWFKWQLRLSQKPIPEKSPEQRYSVSRGLDGSDASLKRTQRIRENLKLKMDAAGGEFNRYIEQNPDSYKPIHEYTHHWGRLRMHFIGFVERFEDDYKEMCTKYAIDLDSNVSGNVLVAPKATCNPHAMCREDFKSLDYYERRTVAFINKRFKLDFKYFGYPMLAPKAF